MGPTELFPSNNQVLNEVSFIACNHADGLGGLGEAYRVAS